ncbi:MAG: PAS domain S-box protein [Usitatibacter sp.]
MKTLRSTGELLELMPDGMVLVNAAGRIILANSQAERLFGYDGGELVGQAIEVLLPPRFRSGHVGHRSDYFARPRRRQMGAGVELYGLRRDGSEFSIEISLSPLQSDEGMLTLSAVRDVTERKRAEQKFRDLLESAPDAMVIVDSRGEIVLVNSRTEQLFGYRREELLGRKVEVLIPHRFRENHPRNRDVFFTQARSRGLGEGPELYGQRKDGGEFPVEITLSPIATESGTLVSSAIRDISERVRIEHELLVKNVELETAERAKSAFLATMSHEIRTPLNGILGMLELLSLTTLDREQRTTVEVVRQSGRMLVRIINDILDYSKIEAGRLTIRNEVASVAAVIHNTISLFSGAASSKGLTLSMAVDERIGPAVWVDPQRLQQVLNNFVSNAIKFTAAGYVEVRADLLEGRTNDNVIRFSVADTGIGIASNDQKQLFEPFTQVDARSNRRFGGTGLGLSICRRLADLMGGVITMESVPNKGTTMHLDMTLPLADPGQLPDGAKDAPIDEGHLTLEQRPAPSVEQAVSEGTLVLIVDDHDINRLVLKRQVAALGYAVETAKDGLEGLEKWQSGRYGIVLADCHMPVLDGYEMVKRMRDTERHMGRKHTPVIACTANALADEADKCFAVGMDDYLAKPLALRDVARKLAQWLPVAGPVSAPMAGSAVDATVLANLSRESNTPQRTLADLFRHVNDQDMANLRASVADRDGAATNETAHRIKGASRMMGALGFAALAERIEKAAQDDNWPQLTAAMLQLEAELARVNAFLESLDP